MAVKLQYSLLLRICLPFSAGYYLSYLFRSVNAVLAPNLTSEFNLSAGDLGLLTSVFFLTFAVIQIPLGILLDQIGPRRTNFLFLLFASMGAIGIASSQTFQQLLISRAVIGVGFAAALMSSFKVFSLWFPKQWLPSLNGVVFFFGGLGAISATIPILELLVFFNWRVIFYMSAFLTLFVAIFILILVSILANIKTKF